MNHNMTSNNQPSEHERRVSFIDTHLNKRSTREHLTPSNDCEHEQSEREPVDEGAAPNAVIPDEHKWCSSSVHPLEQQHKSNKAPRQHNNNSWHTHLSLWQSLIYLAFSHTDRSDLLSTISDPEAHIDVGVCFPSAVVHPPSRIVSLPTVAVCHHPTRRLHSIRRTAVIAVMPIVPCRHLTGVNFHRQSSADSRIERDSSDKMIHKSQRVTSYLPHMRRTLSSP